MFRGESFVIEYTLQSYDLQTSPRSKQSPATSQSMRFRREQGVGTRGGGVPKHMYRYFSLRMHRNSSRDPCFQDTERRRLSNMARRAQSQYVLKCSTCILSGGVYCFRQVRGERKHSTCGKTGCQSLGQGPAFSEMF